MVFLEMGKLSLDVYTLKLIAIINMGIHHTAMVLWDIFPLWVHISLNVLRGISFPIMAFLLVEGYRHSSSVKKYMLRLFIFALAAQFPYMLAFGFFQLNIIFTILLGLMILVLYDKLYVKDQKRGSFVVIFIIILIVSSPLIESAFFGPLLIFMYHVIKDEKSRKTFPLVLFGSIMVSAQIFIRIFTPLLATMDLSDLLAGMPGMVHNELLLLQYYFFPIGIFLVIPLLLAYNGQQGRRIKYLFYAFYPLHFAILAAIAYALGLIDLKIQTFW